jgi:tRNA-uridine 2-sulfurtransferase
MTRERVVVAMSGGVDSAVAAARCVAAGHEVIGISLRLARDGGHCCSLDDFHDARLVAERLGFPHYVFDEVDAFSRHVVEPFVAEYLAGRTPNPCALCNQHVKFGVLWRRARELGASRLATGHYARVGIDAETGRASLRTARDSAKDQTYFLFALGHADLARTLFPIGELTKAEVRAEAAALGLAVAGKPESMEVCFVPDGDAAGFVERHAGPVALRPGPIVDETGGEIGRHDGVHRFTVGQRRGLGVADAGRRYVRALDAAAGTVTIGASPPRARGLIARQVSWVGGVAPAAGSALGVRIRHRHPMLPACLAASVDDVAHVAFASEGPGVTPGQAAVFYRDETVLGGGWIAGELEWAA